MAAPTAVFPNAIATDAALKVANNRIETKLRTAIDAVNTILFVDSTDGFKANSLVSIDKEIVAVESVTGTPNPALVVAAGGRGFDGTSAAAHAGGARVQMLIDAWHHNVLAAEIKALETFLGPQGQNLAALQGYRSTSYNFSPQVPGGSLGVGNNVITLTPVPPGVNGSDAGHYMYISGGSGTAEAVLITGGTAIAGAASGTVIVNCANTHSGAWTISSATGGVQEALIALSKSANTSGTVIINQPASAPCVIHAPVNIPDVPAQFIIEGIGQAINNVERASDYPNGNLFQAVNSRGTSVFRNLGITGSKSSGAVTGASVFAQNASNATFMSGPLLVEDCGFSNGQYCIRSLGVGVQLRNVKCFMLDQTFQAKAAIALEGPFQSGVSLPASNHDLNSIFVFSADVTHANAVRAGLYLNGVDGLTAQNLILQGDIALQFHTTAGNYNSLVSIDQLFIDQAGTNAIRFSSDGTGLTHMISISNAHASGAVKAHGVDITSTVAAAVGRVRFTNLEAAQNGWSGVAIGINARAVQIVGGQILANNLLNVAEMAAITLDSAGSVIRDISIENVQIFNDAAHSGYSGGHQKHGVVISGPSENVIIANNDLAFSAEGTILQINGKMTGGRVEGNTGISDQPPVSVAAATTLGLPVNPDFVIIGTTGVTAISTNLPAGKRGTVQGALTFTAGATIGNTITLAAGKIYPWLWDGTKLWIAG